MKRRDFLATAGATTALTGCLGYTGGGAATGTLTVATYSSFIEGDSPAGTWLKTEFEKRTDATVEFETPKSGLNYYIQRKKNNVPIEADLYVGLNVDHLIRVDQELDGDLFADMRGDLSNRDAVKPGLEFDPYGRAVPYDTGYISLVYDERDVPEPKTFGDLTSDQFEDTLIVQNAQTSATGRAFLLWTINTLGEDTYLDYWQKLKENGITVVGSWSDAYNAYLNGEKPMVVSYSTDPVYANRSDANMKKHRVGFLNDQGYANPEGMAQFYSAGDANLAREFMDFMLEPKSQAKIAVRNVQFPAIENAPLPKTFAKYAKEPKEPVTFNYDELKGNVDGWLEAWGRQIAQG